MLRILASSLALGLGLVAATATVARAEDAGTTAAGPAGDDDVQVGLAGEIGAVGGGGSTPGGLRVGGRYLYRLADRDWFDGGVAFTFGQPAAGCGRVPPAGMSCDHGVADGFAGDLSLGLRRELPGQKGFTPFVRGGGFARVLRLEEDDVGGAALGLELGAGVAAAVGRDVRVHGAVGGFAGTAWLGGDLGRAGQLGMTVNVGAELRLR